MSNVEVVTDGHTKRVFRVQMSGNTATKHQISLRTSAAPLDRQKRDLQLAFSRDADELLAHFDERQGDDKFVERLFSGRSLRFGAVLQSLGDVLSIGVKRGREAERERIAKLQKQLEEAKKQLQADQRRAALLVDEWQKLEKVLQAPDDLLQLADAVAEFMRTFHQDWNADYDGLQRESSGLSVVANGVLQEPLNKYRSTYVLPSSQREGFFSATSKKMAGAALTRDEADALLAADDSKPLAQRKVESVSKFIIEQAMIADEDKTLGEMALRFSLLNADDERVDLAANVLASQVPETTAFALREQRDSELGKLRDIGAQLRIDVDAARELLRAAIEDRTNNIVFVVRADDPVPRGLFATQQFPGIKIVLYRGQLLYDDVPLDADVVVELLAGRVADESAVSQSPMAAVKFALQSERGVRMEIFAPGIVSRAEAFQTQLAVEEWQITRPGGVVPPANNDGDRDNSATLRQDDNDVVDDDTVLQPPPPSDADDMQTDEERNKAVYDLTKKSQDFANATEQLSVRVLLVHMNSLQEALVGGVLTTSLMGQRLRAMVAVISDEQFENNAGVRLSLSAQRRSSGKAKASERVSISDSATLTQRVDKMVDLLTDSSLRNEVLDIVVALSASKPSIDQKVDFSTEFIVDHSTYEGFFPEIEQAGKVVCGPAVANGYEVHSLSYPFMVDAKLFDQSAIANASTLLDGVAFTSAQAAVAAYPTFAVGRTIELDGADLRPAELLGGEKLRHEPDWFSHQLALMDQQAFVQADLSGDLESDTVSDVNWLPLTVDSLKAVLTARYRQNPILYRVLLEQHSEDFLQKRVVLQPAPEVLPVDVAGVVALALVEPSAEEQQLRDAFPDVMVEIVGSLLREREEASALRRPLLPSALCNLQHERYINVGGPPESTEMAVAVIAVDRATGAELKPLFVSDFVPAQRFSSDNDSKLVAQWFERYEGSDNEPVYANLPADTGGCGAFGFALVEGKPGEDVDALFDNELYGGTGRIASDVAGESGMPTIKLVVLARSPEQPDPTPIAESTAVGTLYALVNPSEDTEIVDLPNGLALISGSKQPLDRSQRRIDAQLRVIDEALQDSVSKRLAIKIYTDGRSVVVATSMALRLGVLDPEAVDEAIKVQRAAVDLAAIDDKRQVLDLTDSSDDEDEDIEDKVIKREKSAVKQERDRILQSLPDRDARERAIELSSTPTVQQQGDARNRGLPTLQDSVSAAGVVFPTRQIEMDKLPFLDPSWPDILALDTEGLASAQSQWLQLFSADGKPRQFEFIYDGVLCRTVTHAFLRAALGLPAQEMQLPVDQLLRKHADAKPDDSFEPIWYIADILDHRMGQNPALAEAVYGALLGDEPIEIIGTSENSTTDTSGNSTTDSSDASETPKPALLTNLRYASDKKTGLWPDVYAEFPVMQAMFQSKSNVTSYPQSMPVSAIETRRVTFRGAKTAERLSAVAKWALKDNTAQRRLLDSIGAPKYDFVATIKQLMLTATELADAESALNVTKKREKSASNTPVSDSEKQSLARERTDVEKRRDSLKEEVDSMVASLRTAGVLAIDIVVCRQPGNKPANFCSGLAVWRRKELEEYPFVDYELHAVDQMELLPLLLRALAFLMIESQIKSDEDSAKRTLLVAEDLVGANPVLAQKLADDGFEQDDDIVDQLSGETLLAGSGDFLRGIGSLSYRPHFLTKNNFARMLASVVVSKPGDSVRWQRTHRLFTGAKPDTTSVVAPEKLAVAPVAANVALVDVFDIPSGPTPEFVISVRVAVVSNKQQQQRHERTIWQSNRATADVLLDGAVVIRACRSANDAIVENMKPDYYRKLTEILAQAGDKGFSEEEDLDEELIEQFETILQLQALSADERIEQSLEAACREQFVEPDSLLPLADKQVALQQRASRYTAVGTWRQVLQRWVASGGGFPGSSTITRDSGLVAPSFRRLYNIGVDEQGRETGPSWLAPQPWTEMTEQLVLGSAQRSNEWVLSVVAERVDQNARGVQTLGAPVVLMKSKPFDDVFLNTEETTWTNDSQQVAAGFPRVRSVKAQVSTDNADISNSGSGFFPARRFKYSTGAGFLFKEFRIEIDADISTN